MSPALKRGLVLAASAVAGAVVAAVAGTLLLGGPRLPVGQVGTSGPVKSYGVPSIGGPFALTDQNGEPFTDKDLLGHYSLVFFGFTHCPDFCPTGLQAMTEVLDLLGPAAKNVTPVFITIDPARDTAAVLKDYAALFHPRLMALTGSEAEIAKAAKAYKVYYARAGDGDDYQMDHSTFTYLMGPDGKYRAAFRHGTDPKRIAERIRTLLAGES